MTTPGSGVFTVHTAREKKNDLHKLIYQTLDEGEIQEQWQTALSGAPSFSKAMILGICSDCGGGILRGANWGPLFLRLELLQFPGREDVLDLGDIRVIPHLLHDKYLNQKTLERCRRALYGDGHKELPVSPLSVAEEALSIIYSTHLRPRIFGLGGDHSVSYPLTKTYLQKKQQQGIRTALLHFDAHTDLLQERLGIDLCFASWCTHILDFLPGPEHLIQIGIRSSGKSKAYWEDKFGITQYWADEIFAKGADHLADEIVQKLKALDVQEVYVSFDIDAVDSKYVAATGTPEPDGPGPEQLMTILKKTLSHFPLTGADLVEVAPFLQTVDKVNPEPDSTMAVATAIGHLLIEHLNEKGGD